MGFNWKDKANEEGGQYADPLPDGVHDVEIIRVVFSKKDGEAFRSKSGDPQIMLIFADAEGREASQMVTLSFRAAWVLAKILDAAGADLDAMEGDGVEPKDFAGEAFANANLVGRQLRIEVTWSKNASGREFADVAPIKTDAPANLSQTPDDGIPL